MERRAGRCGQAPPMDRRGADAGLLMMGMRARSRGTAVVKSRAGPCESGPGMRVPSGWARDTSRDVTGRRGWANPSRTFGGRPGGPGLERGNQTRKHAGWVKGVKQAKRSGQGLKFEQTNVGAMEQDFESCGRLDEVWLNRRESKRLTLTGHKRVHGPTRVST